MLAAPTVRVAVGEAVEVGAEGLRGTRPHVAGGHRLDPLLVATAGPDGAGRVAEAVEGAGLEGLGLAHGEGPQHRQVVGQRPTHGPKRWVKAPEAGSKTVSSGIGRGTLSWVMG
jgi:hypothetical protein